MAEFTELITYAPSAIGVLKDVVLTVAACVGIYVGCSGLRTWKRQLVGSDRYQVARNVVRSAYRYRDAIEAARRFAIQGSESAEALKDLQGSSLQVQEEQHLNTIYANRLRNVRQAGRQFDAELLEAEVVLGTDRAAIRKPINDLEYELIRDVRRDMLQRYMSSNQPGADKHIQDAINDEFPNLRRVIPTSFGDIPDPESDPYSRDLLAAVSKIEGAFKGHFIR